MAINELWLKKFIEGVVNEDLSARGDITTSSLELDDSEFSRAKVICSSSSVYWNKGFADLLFSHFEPASKVEHFCSDGQEVSAGQELLRISSRPSLVLNLERSLLNTLAHMMGVASYTAELRKKMQPSLTRFVGTRKTTPLLRVLENSAIESGGGMSHRFGLYDGVMIKDNHLALLKISYAQAIRLVRAKNSHMTVIECEVDSMEQLSAILYEDMNVIMLDNFTPQQCQKAIDVVRQGRGSDVAVEISGEIDLDNIGKYSHLGANFISSSKPISRSCWADLSLVIE